ncbi:MAG: twin transmembrane helix small protein [Pseudomonadota bacterium]
MSSILSFTGIVACLVVLGILAVGVAGFGTGKASSGFSNKMMRWRIAAQAIAVLLLVGFALLTQT